MTTQYEASISVRKDNILNSMQLPASTSESLAATIASTVADNDAIQQTTPPSADSLNSRLLHDVVLAVLAQLIRDAAAATTPVMEYSVNNSSSNNTKPTPAVAILFDAVIILTNTLQPAHESTALAAQCIEYCMETVTAFDCEGVFNYLNSRLDDFKNPVRVRRSHATLLRTCNMLLRRLSKSHNAMLCGRILIFLAKFLPLTEASGLNKTGRFDTANTTPLEDVPPQSLDSQGKPIDVIFYETFWSLQRQFSNPITATQPTTFKAIATKISTVLDRFNKEKVTVTESAPRGIKDGQHGSTVKYLSSSRLLSLQLQDATLRRHFLLQCLILLQYVESVQKKKNEDAEKEASKESKDTATHNNKKDTATKTATSTKKTTTPAVDLKTVSDLQIKVYTALQTTPECGPEFCRAVHHLMDMENAWTSWKANACPVDKLQLKPLLPPSSGTSGGVDGGSKKRKAVGSRFSATYGVDLGVEELNMLWNVSENNTSELTAADRGGFKTLRQLMDPIIDDLNEPDDTMKMPRDARYTWKTLRLIARENMKAYSDAVKQQMNLDVAARILYPDEVPPAPVEEKKTPVTATPAVQQQQQQQPSTTAAAAGTTTSGGGSGVATTEGAVTTGATAEGGEGEVDVKAEVEGGEEGAEQQKHDDGGDGDDDDTAMVVDTATAADMEGQEEQGAAAAGGITSPKAAAEGQQQVGDVDMLDAADNNNDDDGGDGKNNDDQQHQEEELKEEDGEEGSGGDPQEEQSGGGESDGELKHQQEEEGEGGESGGGGSSSTTSSSSDDDEEEGEIAVEEEIIDDDF